MGCGMSVDVEPFGSFPIQNKSISRIQSRERFIDATNNILHSSVNFSLVKK